MVIKSQIFIKYKMNYFKKSLLQYNLYFIQLDYYGYCMINTLEYNRVQLNSIKTLIQKTVIRIKTFSLYLSVHQNYYFLSNIRYNSFV